MGRHVLSALLPVFLLATCGGPGDVADAGPEVRYCMSRAECGADETCLRGVCGRECLWDEDCGDRNAFVCLDFLCRPASLPYDLLDEAPSPDVVEAGEPDAGRACDRDLDCKALDLVCLAGRCDKECDVDVDCGDPQLYCYAHRCFQRAAEPPPEVTEPAPEVVAARPYGAPCGVGSECEGGWCVQNLVLGQKTCTQLCGGDGDSASCPGKDVCVGPVPDPQGIDRWVCVANDAGSTNCSACMSGLSLTNPKGNCLCTVKCPDVSKCPLNMGCGTIQLGGLPTQVCVPVGQACDPSDLNDSPCYGVCLFQDASLTQTFCTILCDAPGDCPAGTTCVQATAGGQVYQWCLGT